MSGQRRHRLVDCNPRWVMGRCAGQPDNDLIPRTARGVSFDCPEGHDGCRYVIPFTPALDGTPSTGWQQNGCVWQRTGDTFETLTLSPSIRIEPTYTSREVALAAGAEEQYLEPTHFCALHIFIRDGAIEFCGDSR